MTRYQGSARHDVARSERSGEGRARARAISACAALICASGLASAAHASAAPARALDTRSAARYGQLTTSPPRHTPAVVVSGVAPHMPAASSGLVVAQVPRGALCAAQLRGPAQGAQSASVRVASGLVEFPFRLPAASAGAWSASVRCRSAARRASGRLSFRVARSARSGARRASLGRPLVVHGDAPGGRGAGSVAPWGTLLLPGSAWFGGHGVDVKSNGPDWRVYCVDPCGGQTAGRAGYAFQCVELIETFLIAQHWISSQIGGDAWQIYADAPASAFDKHPAGDGYHPVPGDVMVWSGGPTGDGHVAIVNSADGDTVAYVQQNAGSATGTTTLSSGSRYAAGYAFTGYLHAKANTSWQLTAQQAANHILRVAASGTAYLADASGRPHWIPDGWTYNCLVGRGYAVIDGLQQKQVDALGNGQPWQARCMRPSDAAGHILRVAGTGTTYLADASGLPHWIPDGGTYQCLQASGHSVIDGLDQAEVDSLGNGKPWATCSNAPDTSPPSVPGSLADSGASDSSLQLSWAASTDNVGVAGYAVFLNGGRVGAEGGLGHTFTGLACSTTYTLGVAAYDAAGNQSAAASVSASTSACPPPPPPATYTEQNWRYNARTFTNIHNASGEGASIPPGATVQVSCKIIDPTTVVTSVFPDGYWYRIASPPWNNAYYSPANLFLNGDPWDGPWTHPTDWSVPDC
jgi:hypothetical protein